MVERRKEDAGASLSTAIHRWIAELQAVKGRSLPQLRTETLLYSSSCFSFSSLVSDFLFPPPSRSHPWRQGNHSVLPPHRQQTAWPLVFDPQLACFRREQSWAYGTRLPSIHCTRDG